MKKDVDRLLETPAGALQLLGVMRDTDGGTVFDPDEETYMRVTLKSGEWHWIAGFLSSESQRWVAFEAIDPETGHTFKLVVQYSEVESIADFPASIVERMPEPKRPFGFNQVLPESA